MENKFNEVFSSYFDSQKKLMQVYADFAKNMTNTDSQENPFLEYTKMIGDFYKMEGFNYDRNPMNLFIKMNKSNDLYIKVYNLYKEIYMSQTKPTKKIIEESLKEFNENMKKYVEKMVFPYIPEKLRDLINRTENLYDSYKGTLEDIYGPWLNSYGEMTDSLISGAFEDPNKFLDYFKIWEKDYDNTFSKLLNIPMMGIDRESYTEKLRTFDKLIKFLAYSVELNIKLSNVVRDTTEKVIEDSYRMYQEGRKIENFEDFYDFWRKTLSEDFDKVFASDEFSKFLGNYVDSLLTLKIEMDKVIEDSLKYMPIPTKTEMDSLYKTVYELKREVRRLKKKVEELENSKEPNEKKSTTPRTTTRKSTTKTSNAKNTADTKITKETTTKAKKSAKEEL